MLGQSSLVKSEHLVLCCIMSVLKVKYKIGGKTWGDLKASFEEMQSQLSDILEDLHDEPYDFLDILGIFFLRYTRVSMTVMAQFSHRESADGRAAQNGTTLNEKSFLPSRPQTLKYGGLQQSYASYMLEASKLKLEKVII
eukprot:5282740-Amphidinium_carterae.1